MTAWTNKDASILRKFLQESETGRKLVEAFKAAEPNVDDKTIEGRALQAAEINQWRKDKNLIKNAMEIQPEDTEPDRGIPVELLDVKE
jgi:hypothetical protein